MTSDGARQTKRQPRVSNDMFENENQVKALSTELNSEQERYRELEERKGRLEGDLQEVEEWKSRQVSPFLAEKRWFRVCKQ